MFKVIDNNKEYTFKYIKPLNRLLDLRVKKTNCVAFVQFEDVIDMWLFKPYNYDKAEIELEAYYNMLYDYVPNYVVKTCF